MTGSTRNPTEALQRSPRSPSSILTLLRGAGRGYAADPPPWEWARALTRAAAREAKDAPHLRGQVPRPQERAACNALSIRTPRPRAGKPRAPPLPREPAVSRGLCCAGDVLSLPPCSGLRVGARHSRKRQGPSPPGRRSKPAALARSQPHAPAVQHAWCSAGVLTHPPRARRAGARGRPHSRPGPSEQLLDRLHGTRPTARGGRAPSAAAERGRRCSPGQVVADFMEDSPAYRCGLIRIGDRITKVTDAQPTRPLLSQNRLWSGI